MINHPIIKWLDKFGIIDHMDRVESRSYGEEYCSVGFTLDKRKSYVNLWYRGCVIATISKHGIKLRSLTLRESALLILDRINTAIDQELNTHPMILLSISTEQYEELLRTGTFTTFHIRGDIYDIAKAVENMM